MSAKSISTVPVAALRKGTVIDHIPAGQGMKLIKLLKLASGGTCVTVGLNLESGRMGRKDLIKVDGRLLTEEEANHVAIYSPEATVNLIESYEVQRKFTVCLPERIEGLFQCPNSCCITRHEVLVSAFQVIEESPYINLKCEFCEKVFSEEDVRDFQRFRGKGK